MNNDLISRSELKSVLKNDCFWCANRDEPCDKSCWRCINEKIDNAPTVERPQGEWIGNAFDEHHCNRCGHPALYEEEPDDYYEVQSNFCPNCGAYMRKGGAK